MGKHRKVSLKRKGFFPRSIDDKPKSLRQRVSSLRSRKARVRTMTKSALKSNAALRGTLSRLAFRKRLKQIF